MSHCFSHILTPPHLQWAHQRCSFCCKVLSVCPCSGTPHTAWGQPRGRSPHGELDKCFMLHRTWGYAMAWTDLAFIGCLGSSKYIFKGHTLLTQCLERRCPPCTLFSGAARWPHRAGMAPGLLSLNSSQCVCSQPWPWLAVFIYRGKTKKCQEQTSALGEFCQMGLSTTSRSRTYLTPRRLRWLRCKGSFDSRLSRASYWRLTDGDRVTLGPVSSISRQYTVLWTGRFILYVWI